MFCLALEPYLNRNWYTVYCLYIFFHQEAKDQASVLMCSRGVNKDGNLSKKMRFYLKQLLGSLLQKSHGHVVRHLKSHM